MATILYKRFIQKRNNNTSKAIQSHPCEHQRTVSHISEGLIGLDHFDGSGRDDANKLLSATEEQRLPQANIHNADQGINSQNVADCSICEDEKKAMSRYRWRLMMGLFFPFLAQSLDTTIIAGAASFIASDFSEFD